VNLCGGEVTRIANNKTDLEQGNNIMQLHFFKKKLKKTDVITCCKLSAIPIEAFRSIVKLSKT